MKDSPIFAGNKKSSFFFPLCANQPTLTSCKKQRTGAYVLKEYRFN
jgi:hypothetical protein